MKYREDIVYGIDLGIGSIGWAVIGDNGNEILDKGVYKFTQAQKAEDRRMARGSRRRLHRKKYRVERMKKLLREYNLPYESTVDSNLLNKRIKAIREKIDLQDLTNIIYYFTKHRGYIPVKAEDRQSELIISLKEKLEYPCLIQNELLKINNKYRSTENPILHSDFEKELIRILNVQSNFYNEINGDFVEKVLDIINTKRKFWEGPGAPREDALSLYGRYRNKMDLEEYSKNPNYRKYLFEELIGNCSVYSGEKRASVANYYAEKFNFYNDFVNLRIPKSQVNEKNIKYLNYSDGKSEEKLYKFSTEAIYMIANEIINSDKVYIKKIIKDLFGIEEFTGYKVNSQGNIEIAKFQYTKMIRKAISNIELYNKLFDDKKLYNRIVEIIQVSPDIYSRKEMITDIISRSNKNDLKDKNFITELSNLEIENKYHAFSEKALKIYLEYMLKDNINSSKVERVYKKEIASDVEDEIIDEYLANVKSGELKYINDKFIEDIVASPATKKSLRKAIAIINKLFSKYGYPKYICIETTRTLLTEEKQKEFEKKTLDNNFIRNKAAKELGDMATNTNIIKYLLLKETNNKCAYCGIDLKVENCEAEHILPISITSDDSYDNKTVSCHNCNNLKKNKSPYEFLRMDGTYSEFKERTMNNKEFSDKKKFYLTYEKDLNKYEKNFKNRNLNDTAYATNELAHQIELFKKAYSISRNEDLETKTLRIPGQYTHACRMKFKIEKDREKEYHHAVDAVIIANFANTRIGRLMDLIQNNKEKFWMSANMADYRDEKEMFDNIFLNRQIIEQLKNADFTNTRFSKEVVKRPNGQLWNSDVRKAIKINNDYYSIEQIDNIYELSHSEVEKKIKNNENLLIKRNNPKLYNKLQEIIEQYKETKGNQFVEFCKENLDIDWTKTKFNPSIHGVRVTNKANADVVIKLRYMVKVSIPFILDKKSVNKKDKTLNICTSLNTYGTRIYTDGEKLYFLPMYKAFIDLKTGKIDTNNSYYKIIYDKYVGKDNIQFVMDLFNNEYVRFEDKNGNVNEGYMAGFHKVHNKIVINNSNSITQSSKNIKKIKSDVLGLYNLNI